MDVGILHRLQCAFDHHLQIIQILAELGDELLILQQLDPQAQPGDGGLEIVGDGAEEALPIIDIAAKPVLHDIDGAGNGDHFAGARLRQCFLVDILAQAHRRIGQLAQWTGLPAHQQHGKEKEQGGEQQDEADLVRRQGALIQRHEGGRQHCGQIEPFARCQLDLGDQYRWGHGVNQQSMLYPGGRQIGQQ